MWLLRYNMESTNDKRETEVTVVRIKEFCLSKCRDKKMKGLERRLRGQELLLCNHKDQSLDPSTHVGKKMRDAVLCMLVIPALRGQIKQHDSGSCWLSASLRDARSWFNKRPCLK